MSVAERTGLVRAFDSGWITPGGPDLVAFEHELAAQVGAHVTALASGTAALHLALEAVGVGPGDDVLVSTLTFAAPAFACTYLGARPVFVDAEPGTWQIDPVLLDEYLSAATLRPRAVVVVDLYGQPADHTVIAEVCARHGVAVVEDAAEALGSSLHGRAAGSFGAAAALSFNGNKIVTTGGGGALVSGDPAVADRARHLGTQARQPVAHYEHHEVGYNYRLSNLLAAVGRGQLRSLPHRIERRRRAHQRYRDHLAAAGGVSFQQQVTGADWNHWLTTVELDPAHGWQRDAVLEALRNAGIEARPGFMPMHLQPVFADAARVRGEVAARHFERSISLPSGAALTDSLVDEICGIITASR
jgi:dTDP-4-amino-4,6-dideoxygalactose transaminase